MRYTPEKKKTSLHISMLLILLGMLSFITSGQVKVVPYIFQIAAIVFLTFSIQVLQRYHLSDFTYIIDDKDNGECIFTVVRTQGKKTTTVCSIDLNKCVYCGDLSGYTEKTVNSFDYRQNVMSKSDFAIIYNDDVGKITVRLEPNDAFADALKVRISTI